MKSLITLILISTSILAANGNSFENSLDHLDIIDLGSQLETQLEYSVNYPGMDFSENRSFPFQSKDCLQVQISHLYPTQEQLEFLSKRIFLTDGAGVLFNNHREVNKLKPLIKVNSRGKKVLRFFLEDLGTYVTGIKVRTFSPYINFQQVLNDIFDGNAHRVKLQFLRSCKI